MYYGFCNFLKITFFKNYYKDNFPKEVDVMFAMQKQICLQGHFAKFNLLSF